MPNATRLPRAAAISAKGIEVAYEPTSQITSTSSRTRQKLRIERSVIESTFPGLREVVDPGQGLDLHLGRQLVVGAAGLGMHARDHHQPLEQRRHARPRRSGRRDRRRHGPFSRQKRWSVKTASRSR